MNAIYLPRRELRAMLHLAGKHDVRSYLNGVFVESLPRVVQLTATDGTLLGTVRRGLPENDSNVFADGASSWAGIIPRDAIERLPKAGKHDPEWLALTHDASGYRLDNGQPFALHDVKYPDFRQLFADGQKREPGMAAQYNPELLMAFAKFAKEAGAKSYERVLLAHTGPDNAAMVRLPGVDGFAGLVMGLRPTHVPAPAIESFAWAAQELRTPAAAEAA